MDESSVAIETQSTDGQDQTITITGLSLEDAAQLILREHDTPGHYQILTQDSPNLPVSSGETCVTVVQNENSSGGYEEGVSEARPQALYITQQMMENGTIQIDSSMFAAQDEDQKEGVRPEYNTVYITPEEYEESQRDPNQSSVKGDDESVTMDTVSEAQNNEVKNEAVMPSSGSQQGMENFQTVHINVIRLEEEQGEGAENDDSPTAESREDEKKQEGQEYVASLVEDPSAETSKEEVKTIDLSKPINITDSTEIMIKGKKCVLMPHPDTGQLCAYPVVNTNQGKRKRGRPRKSDIKREDQDYIPPSQLEEGDKTPPKPAVNRIDQANAVEGLLELSNTGPDGVRRSNRAKKKKTLEDYEMLEDSGDEAGEQPSTQPDENYIPPSYAVNPSNPTGIKRGRGRPRRYPAQGQSTTSIPAVIIPGANGQTLMMAPLQGIQNLEAFQEQIKSLPGILTKTSEGVTTINAQIISTSSGQIFTPDAGQLIATSDGQVLSTVDGQIISVSDSGGIISHSNLQSVINSDNFLGEAPALDGSSALDPNTGLGSTLHSSQALDTNTTVDGLSSSEVLGTVPDEGADSGMLGNGENPDNDGAVLEAGDEDINEGGGESNVDLVTTESSAPGMVATIINSEDVSDEMKAELTTTSEGRTILQIPDDLLPMFMTRKDPIKLGLKASESELEKLKCPKCDFQAFYPQQYQSHIAVHAEDIQKCKCCTFSSFDRESLLQHFKEIHPRCICTVCDFMAEHAYVIKRHMMRHTGDGCTCDICGKTYKDQYILKMHVKMVHMPADVLFECTICYKKFTRKAHLKRHLRIHEAEKPFKCPHCEYRGCERSDISKHLLIHEEPKHVCKVCGKAFRHIKNKEIHMKRHKGQKDYKCGVCDFYGYTFTDIRKHIERRHADIKTLVCDKCGSAFKSELLLREHQKQQCEVFMIEQGYSIETSTGGTKEATVQIPASLSLVQGQHITIDGQQIMVEQVIPEEDISLTEDELRESLQNGAISEAQVIEACQVEMGGVEEDVEEHVMHMEGGIDGDDGLPSIPLT